MCDTLAPGMAGGYHHSSGLDVESNASFHVQRLDATLGEQFQANEGAKAFINMLHWSSRVVLVSVSCV